MALAILTSEVKTAYTSASNGDTLLLTTGTFSDSGQFEIYKTITIRCEIGNTCTFDGLNDHRVLYVTSGSDGVLNLEGIIVTKGGDSTSDGSGGGMWIESSDVTMTSCSITSSSTSFEGGSGGGMFISSSDVTMTSCSITSSTSYEGGGMYIYSSDVTMTSCSITSNTAVSKFKTEIQIEIERRS